MFQLEVADHTSGAQAGSRKRNQRHLATAPRVSFQQHLAPRDTRPPDENGREMIGEGERASGVWSERKRPLPCNEWDQTCEGRPNPRSAVDRKPRADPRDRGSSGHDERNGRPSRASPIQMTGSGTPGEEAPKAHDPQMGNGPLNCSHARSIAPAVLKPYVRLASNKNQRCVSRARPATCSRESLHSREKAQDPGPGQPTEASAGKPTNRLSVRNPQGQSSPSNKDIPRSSEERAGTSQKAEAGQPCRELAIATQMHATRPQALKGNEASPAASPLRSAPRSSRHRVRKPAQGRPSRCDR